MKRRFDDFDEYDEDGDFEWSPIIKFAQNGRTHQLQQLLQYNEGPDLELEEKGATALMWATVFGHLQCITLLIEAKCEVNRQSHDGQNLALHYAVDSGQQCISTLLKSKANPNIGNVSGETPLFRAVRSDIKRNVNLELLLEGKADPNVVNRDGDSVVHIVNDWLSFNYLPTFLQAGANINLVNKNGHTPLMLAVRRGNEKYVKLLLDHGAKTEIKDKNGLSAFQLAERSPNLQRLFFSSPAQKLAFLIGFHKRIGSESPICMFGQDPYFDRTIVAKIFEYY